MIGDGYFQLRAQIGTSLYSLTSLACDLDAPATALDSLQTLQARLREPFLFLAIGGRGAGKSSLLNALFGRDFAGDPAFAGRVITYRYGAEPREYLRDDGSLEIQQPSIFLRDFTLVEIPALDPSETLTRLMPAADLVFIVLHVKDDPTGAWDALARLDREALRRCVIVVQQSDAVSTCDLLLILNQWRHLMITQLRQACPMFPVSAQTRSGLDKLEDYIDGRIVVSPARCGRLREICAAGRGLFGEINAHFEAAREAATQRQRRIEEERLALGARRDQSLRHAEGALWSLTRLFESTRSRCDKLLRRKLTVAEIWRDEAEWWQEFHAELETRLHESIERNLATTIEKLADDLRGAWKQHRDSLRKLQSAPFPPFSHDAAGLVARFITELAACDQDGDATRAVRNACAQARKRLRLPAVVAAAAAVMLAGALLASRFVTVAAGFTAIAALALLIVLGIVRATVLAGLQQLMAARRERVVSCLEGELRAEIDRFYRGLAESFRPSREAEILQPMSDRLRRLAESFERCAADIAARKASAEANGVPAEAAT